MDPYAHAIDQLVASSDDVEIVLVYTTHSSWPLAPEGNSKAGFNHGHRITLSVLDASFNPPTMAHFSLANLLSPGDGTAPSFRPFDAKLLLYSIKNADKTPKASDATPSQRIEMMVLLAQELQKHAGDCGSQNIAVAICQEPTFVGKSTALKRFLHRRIVEHLSYPAVHVQLTFSLGFDTLERLFAPRYYESETAMKEGLRRFLSSPGDDSRIICVRRSLGASYSKVDTNVLREAREFIDSGAITLADIGEGEQTLSSSEVRQSIQSASGGWEQKVPAAVAAYIKENHLYVKRGDL